MKNMVHVSILILGLLMEDCGTAFVQIASEFNFLQPHQNWDCENFYHINRVGYHCVLQGCLSVTPKTAIELKNANKSKFCVAQSRREVKDKNSTTISIHQTIILQLVLP